MIDADQKQCHEHALDSTIEFDARSSGVVRMVGAAGARDDIGRHRQVELHERLQAGVLARRLHRLAHSLQTAANSARDEHKRMRTMAAETERTTVGSPTALLPRMPSSKG